MQYRDRFLMQLFENIKTDMLKFNLAHVSAGLNNPSYLLSMSLLGMFQKTAPDPVG
jgi:hypothetical protein